MPDGFSVDLGALRRAASGISATLDAMATKKVSDIDAPKEAFGHDDLASAVVEFCDRWDIGVYKTDPQTGKVTNYTTYDTEGRPVKRVDLVGRPHGGVDPPHVVEYERHTNPKTGEVFTRPSREAREAFPWEIP